MRVFRSILALCFLLLALTLAAEPRVVDYTFTHLGIEEGVSGPHIFNICQTPDGVVWWSTKNTVDRYNGTSIRHYSLDENIPYSHFAGRTVGLVKSDDGKEDLYAFDNKGLIFRYSALGDRFDLVADVAHLQGHPVIMNHMHVDDSGIWVALESGAFFLRDGDLRPVLDRHATRYILRLESDKHLLCTDNGVFLMASPESRADFFYPGNALTAYYDAACARLWLGTFSSGVEVLDLEGGSASAFPVRELPANPVRSIISLDGETILVGVDGFGVYSVPAKGKDNRAKIFLHANGGREGVLHGNGVYSLLKDCWDNLFIGTYSGGVDVARPTGGVAEIYRNSQDAQAPIPNNHVNCVSFFPAWGTVVGTDDGVSCYKDGRSTFAAEGLVVLDVCEDGDALLLATFGKGVYRMNRSGKATPLYSKAGGELKDDYVYSFFRSADGHLWMGTLMGELVERTPSGFRFYPVQNVLDMVQLPDGKMAVGTASGIRLVTPGSTYVDELAIAPSNVDVNRYVRCLFLDGDKLMVGSDGGGLYILDLNSGESTQFTVRDGLPGNGVCSVVKGRDGSFWLGTENGLCRMDPSGSIYPMNHILALNREYTPGAAFSLSDGRILMGSTSGVLVMDPDKVTGVAYDAPLRLIGAQFKARSEKERARQMLRLLSDSPALKLRFRDNTFELQFESVNLRFQQDIAYQYQMDEGEWSRLSGEGHFRFAEVEAGTHLLRVRAVSRATRSVLDETVLEVGIGQPWWNTWWMWLVYFVLFIGAFVGAWEVYQLHSRYMHLVLSSPSLQTTQPMPAVKVEEAPKDGNAKEFVDSLTRIVLEHLAESAFSIDDLCREMGMSRTYLYVRLKAFTGESPQDFIRFIRMEKAAVLLRGGSSVAEVSDAVGFDNSKYFSTVFKKYFGVSPSKYR